MRLEQWQVRVEAILDAHNKDRWMLKPNAQRYEREEIGPTLTASEEGDRELAYRAKLRQAIRVETALKALPLPLRHLLGAGFFLTRNLRTEIDGRVDGAKKGKKAEGEGAGSYETLEAALGPRMLAAAFTQAARDGAEKQRASIDVQVGTRTDEDTGCKVYVMGDLESLEACAACGAPLVFRCASPRCAGVVAPLQFVFALALATQADMAFLKRRKATLDAVVAQKAALIREACAAVAPSLGIEVTEPEKPDEEKVARAKPVRCPKMPSWLKEYRTVEADS